MGLEGEGYLERELVGDRCCEVGDGEYGGGDFSWVEKKQGRKKEELTVRLSKEAIGQHIIL